MLRMISPNGPDLEEESIHEKSIDGIRASAAVAKTELLKIETKSFNHNIQCSNKLITAKNKEITFVGESNHDALFQVLTTCKSCLVPKFQETINKLRRKHDRNDTCNKSRLSI